MVKVKVRVMVIMDKEKTAVEKLNRDMGAEEIRRKWSRPKGNQYTGKIDCSRTFICENGNICHNHKILKAEVERLRLLCWAMRNRAKEPCGHCYVCKGIDQHAKRLGVKNGN